MTHNPEWLQAGFFLYTSIDSEVYDGQITSLKKDKFLFSRVSVLFKIWYTESVL